MNLGLTGPLNPLRTGNAALGAQPPRPPPTVGREAAGSGGLLLRRPSLRAGVAGAGSSRPARPNPFIAPLPRSPSAARRRLCTFLLGRRARSGSGGAGGGSFAVCPEAGDAPAPPPPQGLRLTRAGPGPGPLALETLALGSPRGPRAGVGIPARTRCREEAKGDLGSDRRGRGDRTRA